MSLRHPTAYRGIDHETLGSDILSILQAIPRPREVLDAALLQELKPVRADQWYPISLLLRAVEQADAKLGRDALVGMGWVLFQNSHVKSDRTKIGSARDVIYGFDVMYRHVNRGIDIGSWKVLSFSPGRAELEKTTPHHCALEEGIMEKALFSVGVSARIQQSDCFRKGAPSCRFVVTSQVTDARWSK
ncbi:MAG TPA: hypothetical protein VEY30_08575 [Myxococcaceae bacterium]|nr:hypothetical protein [Myxococcaceae bacterium]